VPDVTTVRNRLRDACQHSSTVRTYIPMCVVGKGSSRRELRSIHRNPERPNAWRQTSIRLVARFHTLRVFFADGDARHCFLCSLRCAAGGARQESWAEKKGDPGLSRTNEAVQHSCQRESRRFAASISLSTRQRAIRRRSRFHSLELSRTLVGLIRTSMSMSMSMSSPDARPTVSGFRSPLRRSMTGAAKRQTDPDRPQKQTVALHGWHPTRALIPNRRRGLWQISPGYVEESGGSGTGRVLPPRDPCRITCVVPGRLHARSPGYCRLLTTPLSLTLAHSPHHTFVPPNPV